ncbi:MAG: IS5 family transposase [Candidatus Methylacidiphilales bacterium]
MADDRRHPRQSAPACRRRARRQPDHGAHKRGLNTKIHLAVDAHGMPVRVIVTAGTTADCVKAEQLIEGIKANDLIADRGYDTNSILAQAQQQGMTPVIPPKKNRTIQRSYDKDLYKLRHLVENAFLHLKGWRAIATRYAKNTSSFIAAVQIRCLFLWLRVS